MAQREPAGGPGWTPAAGDMAVPEDLSRWVRVRITNLTRGWGLADAALVARSFGGRLRGLIGRRPLGPGEGLVLVPCRQVHGFGIRAPLDVVFCDAEGRVVGTVAPLQPGRTGPAFARARCGVELPAGTLEATGTRPGDFLCFEPLPGSPR